jgi:hypothetical protein
MRRHIPGLHSGQQDLVSNLDGAGGRAPPDGQGNGIVGDYLLQALQEPVTGGGESPRNGWVNARDR